MMFAPLLALHLLGSVQGQVPDKYKEQYQEALEYKKGQRKAPTSKELFPGGKMPKGCSDRCEVMKKVMEQQCEQQGKKKPQMVKNCKTQHDKVVAICEDSCAHTGKIDKNYIKQHMPKPQAPPGRAGPKPSQFGNSEGSSDE